MFLRIVEMAAGLSLAGLSVYIGLERVRAGLKKLGLERYGLILTFVAFAIIETVAIDLVIDPFVPGVATVRVHAKDLLQSDPTSYDLRATLAVAHFGGDLDSARTFRGKRFDEVGQYTQLMDFGWGQSEIQLTVYHQARAEMPLFVIWKHVSIWSRLRLVDTHVYVER